jgi:plasmid rolling circle replication initiator protein Rep
MEEKQDLQKITVLKNKQEIFFDKIKKLKNNINITDKGISRCANCGDFCMFLATKDYDKTKLYTANFCHNRFCPMCAKRKALKDMVALDCMTKWILEKQERRFIFLTLTVPNVCADALDSKIREMNKAFHKLTRRNSFEKAVKGYVKKLELTYNKKADSYHPHFHVLLSVSKGYFSNMNQYVKRDKWLSEWQAVMNDTDITQVDIRAFRENNGKEQKAILELAKYIAKDSDYMISDNAFITFYNSLHKKRSFTFGGDFKEARDLYLNKELVEYLKADNTVWYWLLTFGWTQGKYKERMKERFIKDELDDDLFEDIL